VSQIETTQEGGKPLEIERYPVQAHYGSNDSVDLEYHANGWPILNANDNDPNDGASREFRWAYGVEQRIWVIHTNGEMACYTNVSQCWLDANDRLVRLVATRLSPAAAFHRAIFPSDSTARIDL